MLVTGCTGFIGQHLVPHLHTLGAQVTGIARHVSTTPTRSSSHPQLVNLDLLDRKAVQALVNTVRPTVVFHLAADAIVDAAGQSQPAANVAGTRNLLAALTDNAQSKKENCALVFCSSVAVYGPAAQGETFDEASPCHPASDYGHSKKACEELLLSQPENHSNIGIARLSNVYGPGDRHPSRLVPGAATAIAAGENPVLRSDGTSWHDFVYIDDIVTALAGLAEKLLAGTLPARLFNLSSGRSAQARWIVEALLRESGNGDLQLIVPPAVNAPTSACYYDPSRARDVLGWQATTSLTEGLARTLAWYQHESTVSRGLN